ncbi:MAG: TolC family protein [Candidatus Marinimicrobia bacterium]|nr:TolC family protein [Candidatus Neomarinimicrobiota bacterium]
MILPLAVLGSDGAETSIQDTSLSMREAIDLALHNSPRLQDAQLGLKIAKGQVWEAWSNVLPSVQTNASYSHSLIKQEMFLPGFLIPGADPDELVTVQIGADNVWGAGVSVSQPLFDARAFIGVGTSGRVKQLREEMVRGTTQAVVTGVRQGFLTALLAVERVNLTEGSLARVRQSLEEAEALHRSGLASNYDVLRLDVQLANLDAELHRAKVLEEAAGRNLLVELALPVDTKIVLEGNLHLMEIESTDSNTTENLDLLEMIGQEFTADNLDELLISGRENRSDLRQLNITTSLERARMYAQFSEYFPTLALFYNHNLNAQAGGEPDPLAYRDAQETEFAVAGVNLQFPLFSGFARTARMQQRRAAVRQSQVRHRFQEQLAASQLRNLLADLEDSGYRAKSSKRALEQARRGYEIAAAEYRTGVGSQLQVTDAEVALRQSEFNYSSAIFEYLMVRTQLDAATGLVPAHFSELVAN